jgi:hypothetical protein
VSGDAVAFYGLQTRSKSEFVSIEIAEHPLSAFKAQALLVLRPYPAQHGAD